MCTLVDSIFNEGKLEGKLEGEVLGKLQGRLEALDKMIHKGFSKTEAMDILELTVEETERYEKWNMS